MFTVAATMVEFPGFVAPARLRAMSNFLRKRWLELTVSGGIALFVALNVAILAVVMSNSRDLGILEGRANTNASLIAVNADRVNDIANVLRDFGTRFAWDAIYSPFPTAVLVTKPSLKAGAWKIRMNVLDGVGGNITVYEAKLNNRDDPAAVWMVNGSIKTLDKTALSIEEMEAFAKEAKSTFFAPAYINKKASYIVYAEAGKVNSRFKKLGYAPISFRKAPNFDTWGALVSVMRAKTLHIEKP